MGARATALACAFGFAVPCAGLALLGATPGCSFPEVTFADVLLPDSGDSLDFDAGSPPMGFGSDAQPLYADAAPLDPDGDLIVGDGGCDFNGTWATRITVDVSWTPQGVMSLVLAKGQGTITQWVKGVRTQAPNAPLALSDDSVVCGIALPDFQATGIGLNANYGVRFPDSLFDNAYIPPFTVNGALTPLNAGGYVYSTTPTAVLLGLTMTNPTTDPWPTTVTTSDDMDEDGHPGVTVGVATGATVSPMGTVTAYSDIPTDIPPPFQPIDFANSLYLAIRQVTIASGAVKDCNTISGTVSIPTIGSKAAIDSHILGCALVDGGQCTSTPAAFVDNSEPIFAPTGTTTFQSIRVDAGASCGDVRSAFQ
jgi:hypothetical protein